MNWSENDLKALFARRDGPPIKFSRIVSKPRHALGRLPAGHMNKTEAAYAAHLGAMKHTGEVLWWKFEGVKLRLADATFLTVDFAVLEANGTLSMREVKGFMEEDANVKIKVAASMYPFKFMLVRKVQGGWQETEL